MSEELVIKQCAPTLAGLKTGSLFTCEADSFEELIKNVRMWNRILGEKGIRVLVFRYGKGRGLIYLYRPNRLRTDFENEQSKALLKEFGYTIYDADRCVAELSRRLKSYQEFPHEIGLFLGYPPEDVAGFIKNRAGGSQFTGYWKVYGNLEQAKKTFAKYEKCTEVYQKQLLKGTCIKKLAVAV
ncbi:MAG: DUF3793 family protein [Lachnospiraceae bacterium]|nr:DUF3793 family protein [Lachnospiraceae bacterium]